MLDLELLDAFAKEHAGTDIDAGGSRDLRTKDGKQLREVCLELINPEWLQKNPPTPYFRAACDPNTYYWTIADEEYNDAANEEWFAIQEKRWDWR